MNATDEIREKWYRSDFDGVGFMHGQLGNFAVLDGELYAIEAVRTEHTDKDSGERIVFALLIPPLERQESP